MKPSTTAFVPLRQPGEKRRNRRTRVRLPASIAIDQRSAPIPCVIWDISDDGAKLSLVYTGPLPEQFTLLLPPVHRRCHLQWRSVKFVGVTFLRPPDSD